MSPRTHEQFEEIRDEKKSLIMDVAFEYFANEGYFETTINDIAKRAGISKGLMYNYFPGKEALLREIIHKSVHEAYSYFDLDNDGYLSEDEFEIFVRKISRMYKGKQSFWRLFIQLMIQKEVMEMFRKFYIDSGSANQMLVQIKPGYFVIDITKMILNYFIRKKERKEPGYDPYLDLNMFLISLKGFAITYVYSDNQDDEYYEKSIDRIIELYK